MPGPPAPEHGPDVLFALAGGRYAVEARLGAGGGGEVFAGRDTLLERPVAIKRLPPEAVAAWETPAEGTPSRTAEAEAAARLLVEARALARLSHPNIVAVYDAFQERGCLHLVLERVPGQTLRQRLDEYGHLPLPEIETLCRQLAAALAEAHRQGVVHRDLKPENVLLTPGGVARLVDFGIARMAGAERLTSPGDAVGTPAYVSPEQATGAAVDGRTDLYALGCLLYEAAAGRPPFVADTPLLVISQHLYATPAAPSTFRADLPPAWDALILRLLAKRPEDRLPTAAALLETVDALGKPGVAEPAREASPPQASPVGAATGAPPEAPQPDVPAAEQRIMAADDERDIADVLEFVLRRAGYQTIIAHDGLAAWQRFQEAPPDLVVLDLNMPGMDGMELLRRIRALPGEAAATPVIMLTARSDEATIVEALDAGANDYIAKPFSPRQLLARIRAALRHGKGA